MSLRAERGTAEIVLANYSITWHAGHLLGSVLIAPHQQSRAIVTCSEETTYVEP